MIADKIKTAWILFIKMLGLIFVLIMPLPGQADSEESELRKKLGIPEDAKAVLIFAQSSHVDPDWLLTADEYQRLRTDRTFDKALKEMEKDPRYVYSVECIFFFKRYWDTHPEKQSLLRDYVNKGRIVFSGTGVTSPDTLIPEGENLIRDYLFGYYWLKQNLMNAEPKVAYLPDSFGHSPSLPAILRELGYKYVAFSRIDGSYFIGIDTRSSKDYPLKGSSAELLLSELKTTDFIWRSGDSSEVIAHWSAFSYMQGDMLDKNALAYIYGINLGIPARSPKQTNAKIDSLIKQLQPLSKTGYMFCPIGGDFNPPIPDLNKILTQYNQTRYSETGVFVVLATLEDYFRLVEFHKDKLPVLMLDPNPTFMGFYSSRPELKQRARKLSQSLLLAEALGVNAILHNNPELYPELSQIWATSLFSNHHDFITGTAPDRVYWKEQIPVLKNAQKQIDLIIEKLKKETGLAQKNLMPSSKIQWQKTGSIIKIENAYYLIEIDENKGGCITRWFDRGQNREIISGPSNDIILYFETGGLWRMGQEISAGQFKQIAKASDFPAEITAKEENRILEVKISSQLEGKNFSRILYFRADAPEVRMKMTGAVNKKRTATVAFRTYARPGKFIQELPYGMIERPLNKLYEPTFWAVKNWVDIVDSGGVFGLNLAFSAPGAVHSDKDGMIEMIALRYAPQERVKGIPLLLAFPAIGSDPDEHTFDYAFWSHAQDNWLMTRAFLKAKNLMSEFQLPDSPVQIDREDIVISALKRAESGTGIIIRLFKYSPEPAIVHLSIPSKEPKNAFLTDALERKLRELPIKHDRVELQMNYSLATILVMF